MNFTVIEVYELQNIGKGVINTLTPNNLLKLKQQPVLQGFQDVLDEDSDLPYGNTANVEQYFRFDATAGTIIEINNPTIVSSIIPAARIGKGIGNTTTDVSLAFFPNQAVFTDGLNNRGLEYLENYEANFLPKTLVTKQYVDSKTTGSETKVSAGTNVTVTGNGTTATPYVINSATPDGSETKVTAGTNITVIGNGSTTTPYIVSSSVPTPQNPIINAGWFSGLEVGASTGSLPTSGGGIVSAIASVVPPGNDSIVTVTMATPMANTNYLVRIYLESQGANMNNDNDVPTPVFKPFSNTVFLLAFRELSPNVQNLKVHLEVVQLAF